jgi:thiol:disulfide interchange protein DsbC
MKTKTIVGLLAALTVPLFAQANEDLVRKSLANKVDKVDKVGKSPIAGWYEVIADGQVLYVNDKATHVMMGALIDLKTDRNLTSDRQSSLTKDSLTSALGNAIKQVRGNGKNVLITFEDPNCGYCKKLAKDVQKLKDATVYTFLYPVLGDDSVEKSKAIWCAPDRNKAWADFMTAGKTPPAATEKCDTAGLDASMALGRKLRINGTPAMFFANGERNPGYMPADEIEKRFKSGE